MYKQTKISFSNLSFKVTFLVIGLAFFQLSSFAQAGRMKSKLKNISQIKFSLKHTELGLNVGFMNYSGDLKTEYYTWRQSNAAVGFQVRNELNRYFALRLFANYGHIEGDDAKTGDRSLQKRNLSFKSPITEYGFITEFSLPISYDYRLSEDDPKRYYAVVPYGYVGIQAYHFNPMAYYQNNWVDLQPLHTEGAANAYNLTQIAIPFGLGLKCRITNKISFAFELGIRKTFTDYLDDVSTNFPDLKLLAVQEGDLSAALSYRTDEIPGRENSKPFDGQKRGDSNKKDLYLTNMFSLRYSLGR